MFLLDYLLNSNGGSPSSSCKIIRREGVRSYLKPGEFFLQLAMFNRKAAATSRFGGTSTLKRYLHTLYILYGYIHSYLQALRMVSRWYPANLKQPVVSFKSVGKNVFHFGIGLQGSKRWQNSPNHSFERVQHKPIDGIRTINIPGAHDPNHFCRSCKKTWTPSMHWHLKAGFSSSSSSITWRLRHESSSRAVQSSSRDRKAQIAKHVHMAYLSKKWTYWGPKLQQRPSQQEKKKIWQYTCDIHINQMMLPQDEQRSIVCS